MSDEPTTADLLDRVADELLVNGWRRGALGSSNGEKCLIGAVKHVILGNTHGLGWWNSDQWARYEEAITRLGARLVELLGDAKAPSTNVDFWGGTGLPLWNDHNARDVDDVIELLRYAAKQAREEAQT